MARVAVWGAALNPPHLGHKDSIEQLLQLADTVLVLPSYRHAFGKDMASFEDRLAMAELLIQGVSEPARVKVLPLESNLGADGRPVYTWTVMEYLSTHGSAEYFCAFGPDNLQPEVWQRFYRADDLARKYRRLVTVDRIPVRSTLVRARLAAGANQAEIAALTGPEVAQYIWQHGLYARAPAEVAVP